MTAFFKEIEAFRGTGKTNEKGQTLEEFLEEYDPYKYKNPCVTTDAVIFSRKKNEKEKDWKVLMVKRKNHPSIGWWALPGGFIEITENLEDTAKRELLEETGVSDLPMEQFAVYGNVKRDPRARIITSAYLSVVDEDQVKVKAGDDAEDAKWMQLHCTTESVNESEEWTETIYKLTLENREAEMVLSATVEKKERKGLVRERYYTVKEADRIACDHAALIVQAWKLVESRL